jgi:toxin ParE1/3/4
MKNVVLRAIAKREIENGFSHYLVEALVELALSFSESVDLALKHILNFPASGSRRYGEMFDNPSLRSWPLKRFPYVLFYVERSDHLEIIRLLHQHSDIPILLQDDGSQEN